MKLTRRLSRSVVAVAVVSGLSGVGSALVSVRASFRRSMAAAVREELGEEGHRRCEERPEAWMLRGPGRSRTFAYDARSHASRNPEAPPLDADVARKIDRDPGSIVWEDPLRGGGRIAFSLAREGPCAVLQVVWPGRFFSEEVARAAASAVATTVLASFLLGLLVVVWPLGRRTAALRRAAAQIGEGTGQAHEEPASGDELDLALAGLVAGDARIRADAERLRERAKALERHLADVAHDVRTPLSALQLAVEQAADATESEAARELLASALRDCVYLSGLTENLRMESLLDEGWSPQVSAEPVDLGAVVERICTRAQALARRRGVEVDFALPDERLAVRCDPVAFERAVTNVVDNAVAYGDRGGHVAVTLAAEDEGFVLKVLDDGPGVAPADLPRLAGRAFRADGARSRDPRGSGLGLAITAEICARSGFSLTFSPLSPRGLEVSLRGATGPG